MTTIKILSLGTKKDENDQIIPREIELLPYTHRIAREYKQALLEGVTVGANQDGDTPNIDLPIINQIKAEELQLRLLTGLTQAEIDGITEEEYNTLLV